MLDEEDCCTGCGRTLEEISGWAKMTSAERRSVLGRLARRRLQELQAGTAP